ncbi:antitoxin of bacterial toxin-antitoxin system [Tepidimonas thermarum]|uniref:Antitoxin of bacterial toxin-antitoxin system n=1 Tax=Tepidimonas thermarum TaxID=335431 RepID=A0A554X1D7_9BURK|nr:type II toxin-antitoxin system HicB family antitoxin [Tepidimonas thermarum]TSE29649.1 antitoxin of bacterial toxin-antitoxin system [Tepidimonas thermarum]
MDNAVEAIELHLEGLTEDGSDVPQPKPLSAHTVNPDYAGGVWALGEVDTTRFDGKAETA